MFKKLCLYIFLICMLTLITSCATAVEDNRDYREPNILILPGKYRLFQSSEEVNFIKGKMDKDPVVVEPIISEIGWNKKYIVFIRSEPGKDTSETQTGVLSVDNGEVIILDANKNIQKYLQEKGIDDIEMFTVQQLISEKKKRLENEN